MEDGNLLNCPAERSLVVKQSGVNDLVWGEGRDEEEGELAGLRSEGR